MTVLIGIDPGFAGAVAFFRPATHWLEVHDMPTIAGISGKTEINLHALHDLLAREDEAEHHAAVLERVATRPGQGISSAFRFGQGYGAIEMALAAHRLPVRYVTPSQWKKHFGLANDKNASRGLATQRFPNLATSFARAKDDGRAEAALIALFGWETRA